MDQPGATHAQTMDGAGHKATQRKPLKLDTHVILSHLRNSYQMAAASDLLFSAVYDWHAGCNKLPQTKWRATGRS
jgi:hypothetical protein